MGAPVAFLRLCLFSRWRGNNNILIFRLRRHLKTKIQKVALVRGGDVRAKEEKKGPTMENCPSPSRKSAAHLPKNAALQNRTSKKLVISKTQFGNIRKNSGKFGKWPNGQIRLCSELFGIIRTPDL